MCVCSRFEVLEQICASPDMIAGVLQEIETRKKFKNLFIEVTDLASK